MTLEQYYIAHIDVDLYEATEYHKNLKSFFIIEIKKNKLLPRKYRSILEELQRLAIEIHELENKKLEILKFN